MAKVALRAGAEIDFLNSEEMATHLKDLKDYFSKMTREEQGDTIVRAGPTFSTDANGNTSSLPAGGGVVFQVPVGYDAYIVRLSVDFEASNASSPTGCDLRVCADQNTPAALRSIAAVVPNVFSSGRSHAPLFRGGQNVVVAITGGPATTVMYCTVQALLIKRRTVDLDVLQ